MNPILWLRLSSFALLDAPQPPAIKRMMLLQCAYTWTVALLGLFSAADLIMGTGWFYTVPVTIAAAIGIWHTRKQLASQAQTSDQSSRGDYVAAS